MKFLATSACIGVVLSALSASAAEDLKGAFAEGTLKGEIRTFYYSRDFEEKTPDRADLALGTLMYYRTAPLFGLTAGLGTATASDIGSDDDKAVYGLLARDASGDHDSFTRLQEYFLQGSWFNTTLKLGAQEIESPFLNGHDIRLLPKTYRGLTVENTSVENLTVKAYYLTDFMGWTDDDFVRISSVAKGADDEALLAGSVRYKVPLNTILLDSELWDYRMEDVFNSTYLKATLSKKFETFSLSFTPSFLKQDSIGDDLGGQFDTLQYGFNTSLKIAGFDVTAFYAKTGDDDLFVPWGDGKVLIQQINASGRADENAYALRLGYDFGTIGATGLSAYVFHGLYDTPDSGTHAASDINETDLSAQYAFSGSLDGLSLRVRYALVDYDSDTADDFGDFRIYLKYTFSLGGKS